MSRINDTFSYTTKDESELMRELKEIRANSSWDSAKGEDIRILSVQPIEVPVYTQRFGIEPETLADTADENGTGLLVKKGPVSDFECLRDTGYYGFLQTALGLNGPGINRLRKRSFGIFTDCCNEFLKSNSKELKLYHSCDKLSGVFTSSYNVMEIDELIEVAKEQMQARLKDSVLTESSITHSLTTATWRFDDVKEEIQDCYDKAVSNKFGAVFGTDFTPMVKFGSSNTGFSCATLTPYFQCGNRAAFPAGRSVRIRHGGRQIQGATGCDMEAFRKQAGELMPLFSDGIATLAEMSNVLISNPQNAFIGLCNDLFGSTIPRKWASDALEEFLVLNGTDTVSFEDVFYGVCNILSFAEKDKATPAKLVELSENLAKVYVGRHTDWNAYDVSGTVAWINGNK